MVGDPTQDVAELGERIDLDQFARGDEAAKPSRSLATVVAAEEGPVVAANDNAAANRLRQ